MKNLQELSNDERLNRHKKEWSILAGEPVEIKIYENDIYAFGSELACLRLYYTFRHCEVDKIKVEFSKTYNCWFFAMYK